MQFFRRLVKHKKLAGLVLVGIVLRSLIASGFMLDTNPADGSLFSIILCDGPASINAIDGLDDDHSHHHEHHHHDHETQVQDHGFSACSFWSSSGQSLIADISTFDFTDPEIKSETIAYQSRHLLYSAYRTNHPRAPPTLS